MTSPEPLIPVDAARVRDVLARHDRCRRARWLAAGAFIATLVAVIVAIVIAALATACIASACWQGFPP